MTECQSQCSIEDVHCNYEAPSSRIIMVSKFGILTRLKTHTCLEKLALKIDTKNLDLDYSALLELTGILNLSNRRQYLTLHFFSIVCFV